MQELIFNTLRGSVTAIMNILLFLTLSQPRFGHKTTYIAIGIVFFLDIATNTWFYWIGDLTALSRFDTIFFIVMGLALKPLVKDSFMKWCFNTLTSINIMIIIVILSYHLSRFFPEPQYFNTLIRLVFYIGVILLFRRRLLSLYQPVVNNWPIFLILVISISLNLAYSFYFTDDIENTLITLKWPLLLLILLAVSAYGTVFYSLKKITATYALETENLRIQNDAVLLHQAAATMVEKLQFMDKVAYQNSLASHDRHHFDGMILELLKKGQVEEAKTCLLKQNAIQLPSSRSYCENAAVNAVVCYYADMAEQKGIQVKINLDIPTVVNADSLELAMVISNLMENAIHGVALLPEGKERFIHFTCLQVGRLLIEIANSCLEAVTLDSNGLPFTKQVGHGIGTKSIIAFAAAHNAELLYHVDNGQFRVRLLV
ncbi:GHKL domain-containing protein [uncultured Sphaerochaeta sp.]|uniref:GHKL domain-containing protein n=1 Tax=uncultured Sphaerochaeta sp. TaxID=886478 RepID=UPI002A0A4D46|nr:GHKL domain-containing protein [uncultured Sphaerochaeta sp.]